MTREKIVKHLIRYSILSSMLIGLMIGMALGGQERSFGLIPYLLLFGILLVYPVILTLLNLYFLFKRKLSEAAVKKGRQIEYITIALGSLYSVVVFQLQIFPIKFQDWTATLVNQEVHSPIWSGSWATILVIAGIGIGGYLLLSFTNVNKMPPLVSVCAIAAMYLGALLCILWIVQIFSQRYLLLCLFPFNCMILTAKTVRYKVYEWKTDQLSEPKQFRNKFLNLLNQKLFKSERWPTAGFVLMWPLLGLIILILVLFGQQPDSIIKGWTETSDWNLSTRVSPQNVYFDEHYLCTVAAGGHAGIVKPIRMGERHGHRIIVNRQLCIANAFEQVLEERIPVIHRHLRSFYDHYGFPVAKLIQSPYAADCVYLIMKPLELFFLVVLYFSDVNPENRIAVQYLPYKK